MGPRGWRGIDGILTASRVSSRRSVGRPRQDVAVAASHADSHNNSDSPRGGETFVRPSTTAPTTGATARIFPLSDAFDYQPLNRVIFGSGRLRDIGAVTRELGSTRPMVITDAGLVAAGHADAALESLKDAGLSPALYRDVHENPTGLHVQDCAAAVRAAGADLLIGLGGGSSMDTAKGANFLVSNGGRIQDYWGIGKASKPMLPSIAVPTTAGTGSEAQSFALISDEVTHQKMACGDKKVAFRVAILDPSLTLSLPAAVTAACGIDAISHAVESFVSTAKTPISRLFSREAWRLLSRAFPTVIERPGDAAARGEMLLGAYFSGSAIEASMLGATHAAANPLTAALDVVHGRAIGLMLPHVVRHNAAACEEDYALLSRDAGGEGTASDLADRLDSMVAAAGLPTRLRDLPVEKDRLSELAESATREWTGRFNPRPMSADDFRRLYEYAY